MGRAPPRLRGALRMHDDVIQGHRWGLWEPLGAFRGLVLQIAPGSLLWGPLGTSVNFWAEAIYPRRTEDRHVAMV